MSRSERFEETLGRTLRVIKMYFEEKGYPPSIREIMAELNVASTSTIKYYLDKLEEKNLIRRTGNKNRAIEVIKNYYEKDEVVKKRIPLLGEVAAGKPIFAFENYEEVYEVSENLFCSNSDIFMLTVKGDSMINAGIYEKDKIVVKKQNYAENGEIVVAMIAGSATVKRFYKEDDHIRLQPENDYMKPIYCFEVDILGKVIGLIRNY
ncbi:MAG: transcriptional repressor LexA [Clostridia bacterium]|nr:transcriptional repressor LexA [Clostridia bacterium]